MNGLMRLCKQISSHAYLKEEDAAVVLGVCTELSIRDEPGLINQYLAKQVEIEADALYLFGRYSSIVNKLRSMVESYKAEKFVDMGDRDEDGIKWTKQSREQWLLAMDVEYPIHRESLDNAEVLLSQIKGLYSIVFGRDRKLEQLSNNYRREMKSDEKSSGY